jgi:hypothetical protein
VLVLEMYAQQYADRHDACKKDYRCMASVQYFSHMKQHMADSQVEERPEDIDCGRGQSLAGRASEWGGKGIARDAVHEVWHGIREKYASEESGEILIPLHGGSPFH